MVVHLLIHTWWNTPITLLKCCVICQSNTMLHVGHFIKVHIMHRKHTGIFQYEIPHFLLIFQTPILKSHQITFVQKFSLPFNLFFFLCMSLNPYKLILILALAPTKSDGTCGCNFSKSSPLRRVICFVLWFCRQTSTLPNPGFNTP